MRLNFCLVLAVCIGISTTHINHENNGNVVTNGLSRGSEDSEIPDILLISMKDVENFTDFVNNFVMYDNQPEAFESEDNARSDKTAMANNFPSNYARGRILADAATVSPSPLAGCVPLKTVVGIPRENDMTLFYWPMCVHINRCSGCCSSRSLSCSPVETSREYFNVMKARYAGPNFSKFVFEGYRVVSLEKHERCSCECRTRAENCSPQQVYREDECRCTCQNKQEMSECNSDFKFWDEENCICKCRETFPCSSGYMYNTGSCRCEAIAMLLQESIHRQETNDTDNRMSPNDTDLSSE